jgi:hypothetical protein
MQTITVASEKDRHYTALIDDKAVATLIYPKWYSQNAEITIGNSVYKISNNGIFLRSGEVFDDEKIVFNIRTRYRGTLVSRIKGTDYFYTLKPKGFFKYGYMLENNEGREIMELKQEFRSDKTIPNYKINTDIVINNDVLLIAIVATYYFRIAMNEAAVSAVGAS